MMRTIRLIVVSLAAAMASAMVGCAGGTVTGASAALKPEQSPEFIDRVSSLPTVNENDAFRGVLLLVEGKDESRTFGERVAVLQQRRLVDPSWTFDAARPITRGKLAYMVCQALQVRRGVILSVSGPSQRYCLRELQYNGFFASGIQGTQITGGEFVAVLGRADAFKSTGEVPSVLKAGEAQ